MSDRSARLAMPPDPVVQTPGRKERTRIQIRQTASELFLHNGFVATRMEDIAIASGIRRSTLYTHYRDKDAILADIIERFLPEVRALIGELPGPVPDGAAVLQWVESFAELIRRRPGPAQLVLSTGHLDTLPEPSRLFANEMMQALGTRMTAFARAAEPGEFFLLAWAQATLHELAFAVTIYARDPDHPMARERLRVAAALFARFARMEP